MPRNAPHRTVARTHVSVLCWLNDCNFRSFNYHLAFAFSFLCFQFNLLPPQFRRLLPTYRWYSAQTTLHLCACVRSKNPFPFHLCSSFGFVPYRRKIKCWKIVPAQYVVWADRPIWSISRVVIVGRHRHFAFIPIQTTVCTFYIYCLVSLDTIFRLLFFIRFIFAFPKYCSIERPRCVMCSSVQCKYYKWTNETDI